MMKKSFILAASTILLLMLTQSAYALTNVGGNSSAAAPGGGGGPVGPGGRGANATCGSAVNGNGTFPFPGNRQREWPGGSRSPLCGLSAGGNSSNYAYVSSLSVQYSAAWASNPSYNVTTQYVWTCSVGGVSPGSSTSCSLGRVNRCGGAHGQSLASAPGTSSLCAFGNPSGVGTTSSSYVRSCSSSYGYGAGTAYYSDNCSATRLIPSCGSSHGKTLINTPNSGLCNSGNPSAVNSTSSQTTYTWSCSYPGGSPVNCSATKAIVTSPCTNPSFAASDYAACQTNGTCTCYNVSTTSPSSTVIPGYGGYSGAMAFKTDSAGRILPAGTGASLMGALTIWQPNQTLNIGVGAVGINRQYPAGALDVAGKIHFSSLEGGSPTSRLMVSNTGLLYKVSDPLLYWARGASSITYYNNGNVGIGTSTPTEKLQVIGNVRANSFLTNSDRSLKYNITTLSHSLAKVLTLNPVSFTLKADDSHQIGFIAQEVEKVFPEVVVTDSQGIKSVAYANLIAPLTQAVQEINQLLHDIGKERLAEQQSRIQQLEQSLYTIKAAMSTR